MAAGIFTMLVILALMAAVMGFAVIAGMEKRRAGATRWTSKLFLAVIAGAFGLFYLDDAMVSRREAVSIGRRVPWGTLSLAGLVLFGLWVWLSPPNSFPPTCTYTINAVVSAEVEASGEKLSSTVVHQNSRSRRWISIMNSAGCRQRYGNALVYRLANASVLIIPARLCHAAEKQFAASGQVDILRTCAGEQARQDRAFIVDSESRPERWRSATNGVDFRIISMAATSTWRHPADDITSIAPNLLKAHFMHDRSRGITWGQTPEAVIDYWRRYDVKKSRSDKSFEFEVRYDDF